MHKITNWLIVMVALSLAMPVIAEVPRMMNYQGHLTDGSGQALDTTVSMTFSIYDDSIGSGAKWTEIHPVVSVDSGGFSVILGVINPIDDTVFVSDERWLGIRVGSDPEISPRVHLVSVPYAYKTGAVDGFNPGPNNVDSGMYTFIAGDSNKILADYSSICGGFGNIVDIQDPTIDTTFDTTGFDDLYENSYRLFPTSVKARLPQCDICDLLTDAAGNLPGSDVCGGYNNHAGGPGSFIGGGSANEAFRAFSTVTGGGSNKADGYFSTIGGGYCNHTLWSTSYPGQPNIDQHTAQTIGGGWSNCSDARLSTIGGGGMNTIETGSRESTIGGGGGNSIHNYAPYGTIAGGHGNAIWRYRGTIAGGWHNVVVGNYSTIGGGGYNGIMENAIFSTISGGGWTDNSNVATTSNRVWDNFGTIGGGGNNDAGSSDGLPTTAIFCTVGGGEANQATGNHSTIGGGIENAASGDTSFVGGGWRNQALGKFSTIGGGSENSAAGDSSFVGGGNANYADALGAVVGGGTANNIPATAVYGTISGGYGNQVNAGNSTVGGGGSNQASGPYSTIGGGNDNTSGGNYSSIAGGKSCTATGMGAFVGGGDQNHASGNYSMIPGGTLNSAGDYSWAGGVQAGSVYSGCFVWSDPSPGNWWSTANNQFLIRASGHVGINVNDPTQDLDVLGTARLRHMPTNTYNVVHVDPSTGVLYDGGASSRRYKNDIRPLDIGSDKVLDMQPVRFRWKSTGKEDVGLIAEEVQQVVPDLVTYDASGEPAGVKYDRIAVYLLQTIKEQDKAIRELRGQLSELRDKKIAEIESMKAQMNEMRVLLESILVQPSNSPSGSDDLAGNR